MSHRNMSEVQQSEASRQVEEFYLFIDTRLDELAKSCSEEGWDSYGGKAVTPQAVAAAKYLLKRLFISPTNRGGIEVEFDTRFLTISFEFSADGTFGGVYVDSHGKPTPVATPLDSDEKAAGS